MGFVALFLLATAACGSDPAGPDPARSAPSLPTPEEDGRPGLDPGFVDAANGDFTLAPDSPAAGAGAQVLPR